MVLASSLLLLVAVARAQPAETGTAATDCVAESPGDCTEQGPRVLAPGPRAATLDNGVRLGAVPAPTSGRVAIELRVRPPGGLVAEDHVLAFLIGQDDAGASGSARRQRRALLGAEEGLEVGPDAVVWRVEGASSDLAELLDLEAGRLSDFAPTSTGLRRAALAVQAQRLRRQVSPDLLLADLAWGRDPAAGEVEDAAVRARFGQAWAGAGLTVVVAGDVDPSAALELARSALQALPAAQGGPPPPQQGEPLATGMQEASAEGAATPRVGVAWRLPVATPGSAEEAARAVLRELLGSPHGRLWDRLAVEQGLVTRLWSPQRDDGLAVLAEVRADAHPGAVLATVDVTLRVLAEGEDQALAAEVERARLHLARRAVLALEEPGDWAAQAATALAAGGSPEAATERIEALGAVDAAAVRALAGRLLAEAPRREVVLRPAVPVEVGP